MQRPDDIRHGDKEVSVQNQDQEHQSGNRNSGRFTCGESCDGSEADLHHQHHGKGEQEERAIGITSQGRIVMKSNENDAHKLFRRLLQTSQGVENDRHEGDGNEADRNVHDGMS